VKHNDEVAEVEFPRQTEAEDVLGATAARIKSFQSLLVNLVAFAEADGVPHPTLETNLVRHEKCSSNNGSGTDPVAG